MITNIANKLQGKDKNYKLAYLHSIKNWDSTLLYSFDGKIDEKVLMNSLKEEFKKWKLLKNEPVYTYGENFIVGLVKAIFNYNPSLPKWVAQYSVEILNKYDNQWASPDWHHPTDIYDVHIGNDDIIGSIFIKKIK